MRRRRNNISAHRTLAESRLAELLERAEIGIPVATIKSIISENEHAEFRPYLNGMLALFSDAKCSIEEEVLLSVVQDAWNYFPHRSLKGLSPIEMMDQF
jgi:hypothetical protein